jgi:hypothetical protein
VSTVKFNCGEWRLRPAKRIDKWRIVVSKRRGGIAAASRNKYRTISKLWRPLRKP